MSAKLQHETTNYSSHSGSEDDSFSVKVASGSPYEKSRAEVPARTNETISTTDEIPPNGGLEAQLQVVGAFILFMNSW